MYVSIWEFRSHFLAMAVRKCKIVFNIVANNIPHSSSFEKIIETVMANMTW